MTTMTGNVLMDSLLCIVVGAMGLLILIAAFILIKDVIKGKV